MCVRKTLTLKKIPLKSRAGKIMSPGQHRDKNGGSSTSSSRFSLLTVRRGGVRRIVLARYKNAFICIQAVAMPRMVSCPALFCARAYVCRDRPPLLSPLPTTTTDLRARKTVWAPAHMVMERTVGPIWYCSTQRQVETRCRYVMKTMII